VLPEGPLPANNREVHDIASMDVNRDGRPDLLLRSTTATYAGFGLQVLINQGNGTFVDETAARLGPSAASLTGPSPSGIRLADFNGDGLQDFYFPQLGGQGDYLSVPRFWLNNGNGTFTPITPSALPQDFGTPLIVDVDFDGDGRPDIVQLGAPGGVPPPYPPGEFISYRSFLNHTPSPTAPFKFPASPMALRFGATKAGAAGALIAVTPAQDVTLSFGAGTGAWTAASNQSWLQISSGSGTGSGRFTAALVNPGNVIGGSTLLTAWVTVTAAQSGTYPLIIPVTLTIDQTGAGTTPPFGAFDTPANNATGLTGAIPVTGWALDDVGIFKVQIWRNCVEAIDRPASACFSPTPTAPADFVYIGDGAFIPGARPDVELGFPTYPAAYRGGWGYLMSTNALPHLPSGPATGGQGTFVLSAYAIDVEGHYTLLGTKTIALDNDHATLPFGTLDTPSQGGTVTTSPYASFGWAMTQTPKCIDTTTTASFKVYIDGVSLPLTAGANWLAGLARPDIAGAYPGRCNTNNALAAYYIDVNALGLANGLHTTGWDVFDNLGNAAGIGSRFFNVLIGSSMNAAVGSDQNGVESDRPVALGQASDLDALAPAPQRSVRVRVGSDEAPSELVAPDSRGQYAVQFGAGGRVALDLGGAVEAGYQLVGDELRALPVGSALNAAEGQFAWQPPVPFLGPFHLVFVSGPGSPESNIRLDVLTTITDPTASTGIEMHIDTPAADASVSGSFVVAGWALDPLAATGSGIDTLHVWAYRRDAIVAPQFLGAAAVGGARPDVAAIYGAQFESPGFTLTTSALAPGVYDLVVYPWSHRTGAFAQSTVVRVVVR
jgi:hypothetical protein